MSVRVPRLPRLGSAVAALAALAAVALAAAPAAAAGAGYVRLAHLSPDTPPVDVYLKPDAGDTGERVFPGVAYGAMSQYLRLPAGTYSVAMRKAGADPGTKPVLTLSVTVEDGDAYTVAGVGRYADLGLRVLRDDLELPGPDRAKIRIIQASVRAPVLDVAVDNGPPIADAVQFATTTGYRDVKAGRWRVKVQPSGGGTSTSLPCTLGAGSVYSLLVLDAQGGLKTELHLDASRRGAVPLGGVATGDGGTQPGSPMPTALLLGAVAAALTGGTVVAIRRRPRAS